MKLEHMRDQHCSRMLMKVIREVADAKSFAGRPGRRVHRRHCFDGTKVLANELLDHLALHPAILAGGQKHERTQVQCTALRQSLVQCGQVLVEPAPVAGIQAVINHAGQARLPVRLQGESRSKTFDRLGMTGEQLEDIAQLHVGRQVIRPSDQRLKKGISGVDRSPDPVVHIGQVDPGLMVIRLEFGHPQRILERLCRAVAFELDGQAQADRQRVGGISAQGLIGRRQSALQITQPATRLPQIDRVERLCGHDAHSAGERSLGVFPAARLAGLHAGAPVLLGLRVDGRCRRNEACRQGGGGHRLDPSLRPFGNLEGPRRFDRRQ